MYDIRLEKALLDYGLSLKEVKIYLSCLELGSAPLSVIARRTKENRVTIYSILKSMKDKGLITSSRKNKMAYYSALSPKILMEKLQHKYSQIEELLPEFLNISQSTQHPIKVTFFEGFEHLKDMYKDILQYPNTTVRGFRYSSINEQFQDYIENYIIPNRIKKNIGVNYLLPQDYFNECNNPSKKAFMRNIRAVPREDFILKSDIVLYGGDKVIIGIFDKKKMAGTLVQNQGLHDTLLSIFTALWHSLDEVYS